MTRKLILIGIVLVGFVLALGSNAWADRGNHGKRHTYGKNHHQCHKANHGHHHGWAKGKRNLHRDRDHRWDRDRHNRWDRHRDHYYKGRNHRKRVEEKHVYHHYPKRHRYNDDSFSIVISVIDQFF